MTLIIVLVTFDGFSRTSLYEVNLASTVTGALFLLGRKGRIHIFSPATSKIKAPTMIYFSTL